MNAPPAPPEPSQMDLVLARHATRRAVGIPAGSVLVGPIGAAVAEYRTLAIGTGSPVRIGTAADPTGVAALIVRAARGRDLVADACAHIAART